MENNDSLFFIEPPDDTATLDEWIRWQKKERKAEKNATQKAKRKAYLELLNRKVNTKYVEKTARPDDDTETEQ